MIATTFTFKIVNTNVQVIALVRYAFTAQVGLLQENLPLRATLSSLTSPEPETKHSIGTTSGKLVCTISLAVPQLIWVILLHEIHSRSCQIRSGYTQIGNYGIRAFALVAGM